MNSSGNDAPEVAVPRGELHKEVVTHQQQHQDPQRCAPQSTYPLTEEHVKPNEKLCGLARTTLILLVILAIVIIGAAVGGGVGGSLAVQNAKSQASNTGVMLTSSLSTGVATPTTTLTDTSSAPSTTATSFVSVPTDNVSLDLDCPNIGGTKRQITLGSDTWTFDMQCGVDYVGAGVDIIVITAYSLDDCLKSCASFNMYAKSNERVGIEFRADLSAQVAVNYGNCWAKNSSGTAYSEISNLHVGALLV
ncbi:hypothetical protein BJ170DRAFT_593803 [Xylariales sp. AK1849]|nr:hypothetical protein BJ170DRAFT_593803 [Xylariales sp. AK1849]